MAYPGKIDKHVNASDLQPMHGIKYCLKTEGRQFIHLVRADGNMVFSGKKTRLVFAYNGEHLFL